MGKKIQGAKLRALKRAKVALEELQDKQAEDAIMTTVQDLFVIDRTGNDNIPHHLRPSKVHKASSSTTSSKVKYPRNHLSSIDEQKVQKILKNRQSYASSKASTASSLANRNVSISTNLRRNTSIKRKKENFDLWNDDGAGVEPTSDTSTKNRKDETKTEEISKAKAPDNVTTSNETVSSIIPRTVKFTAEGIRKIVVSTATAIKDSILNQFTSKAPAGVAPIHVTTKAIPTSVTNKGKNTVITKVIGDKKLLIPIEKKKIAVDTSLTSGQSYRPDPIQHQKLLQTAIKIEVTRNQVQQKMNTPISTGLSAETRAILMQDDDSDDDDDSHGNNAEDTNVSMAVGEIPKRLNKLTTAQRNKQKLRRQQEAIIRKQKMEKKLLNDGEIPKYNKEIKRQQNESIQKQLQKIQQQQQKLEIDPLGTKIEIQLSQSNPINVPTLPIALSNEIKQSSLRTIIPKGSMMSDRAYSLSSRHPSISPVIPLKRIYGTTTTNNKIAPTHKHRKKRKLSLKGKHNADTRGDTFEILG